jgi:hypothetical protein
MAPWEFKTMERLSKGLAWLAAVGLSLAVFMAAVTTTAMPTTSAAFAARALEFGLLLAATLGYRALLPRVEAWAKEKDRRRRWKEGTRR